MNPVDAFISKKLKRYAARQFPPAHTRIRLLHAASSPHSQWSQKNLRSSDYHPIIKKQTYEDRQSSVWSLNYFDWASIYSLGVMNMRHVL